jgi:7,8-dihydroneopterin 2',3'-cyclic phosphate phosphodiesterase
MKRLIELANKIKDRELRKKVLDVLRDPRLTNKSLKYAGSDLKETPASVNWHHVKKGGLIEHTYSVTLMSISIAEVVEKVYKTPIDYDSMIAASLLHDIGKLWGTKKTSRGWEATSLTLDHTILGTSELYARGFPEPVLHIVASHFGDQGPTPPQTIEAVIFHYADSLDAILGTSKQDQVLQLLLG